MEKYLKCTIFVGKYDSEEHILVCNGHIIGKQDYLGYPKYSLIYINDDIEIIDTKVPLIKKFNKKISNSEKEAILAFMAFQLNNKSV